MGMTRFLAGAPRGLHAQELTQYSANIRVEADDPYLPGQALEWCSGLTLLDVLASEYLLGVLRQHVAGRGRRMQMQATGDAQIEAGVSVSKASMCASWFCFMIPAAARSDMIWVYMDQYVEMGANDRQC